jgi:LPXTG-motif cell wall-anchored protein
MNQNQQTVKKKAAALLTLLALMLMALLVATAPAPAGQESKGPTPTPPEETAPPARPETVTVTFELTIDGEVPEGYSLYLSGNRTDPPSPEPFGREFCHTDRPGEGFVTCEDGGTYSQAYEVPRGSTLSYQYAWRDLYPTPGGGAPYFGTFFTEQRTFTEDATVSVTYTGTEEPGDESATLSFELDVECEPPAGTQFFGFIPAEGGMRAQLADPGGDGLYTGSMTVDKYGPGPRPVPPGTEPVTLGPIQIVEGTDREVDRVIEDFGEVKIDGDKAFTASDDSFCEGGGGSADGGSDDNGSSDSDGGFLSGLLPETGGGWAVLLLIVGAVLIGGGWLLVRRIEQMYEQM